MLPSARSIISTSPLTALLEIIVRISYWGLITALIYIPLEAIGVPLLIENPVVQEVAKKLGATPAQVLIAWGVYRGYSVIPKSVHEGSCFFSYSWWHLS